MKIWLSFILLVFSTCLLLSCSQQPAYHSRHTTFHFRDGDLLFQDLDCGPLCDAIEKVTQRPGAPAFSHIGLVCMRNDSPYVLEAIGQDVHLTALDHFLERSVNERGLPKVICKRLKPVFQTLNEDAITYAKQQLGKPYDDAFIYANGRYYCSELIYDAYKHANHDQPFFDMAPMTFKDPATQQTFPAWQSYYKDLGMAVPEGLPGCNPSGIAASKKLEDVKLFK